MCGTTALRSVLIAAALGFCLGSTASAVTLYWDGTGTATPSTWDTASSWSTDPNAATPDPAAPPGASDVAYFNTSTVTTAQAFSLTSSPSVAGLVFNNLANVTLTTSGINRQLNVGTGGITVNSTVVGGVYLGYQTSGYYLPIALQGTQTWTINGPDVRIKNGALIGAGGDQTLTLDGTDQGVSLGDYRAVSALDLSDGAGVLSLNKTGSGRWVIYGNNTYTGTTTISQGVWAIQTSNALGSTAGGTTVLSGGELSLAVGVAVGDEALTLNGSGADTANKLGALRAAGTSSYAGLITLGSDARIAAVNGATLTISNAGTITGDGFNLTVGGNNAGTVTINSNIGTGAGGLTLNGAGEVLNLLGNNTYTGGTTVVGGTLKVGSATALGATSGSLTVGENTLNPAWGCARWISTATTWPLAP